MSIKRIENLRQILLMVLFGALSCHLAVSAIGQSERARFATQTQKPVRKGPRDEGQGPALTNR